MIKIKYRISDVARILGMTPGALHFFESEDIINIRFLDSVVAIGIIVALIKLITIETEFQVKQN